MAWTKEGKMKQETKRQQAYLNKYEAKIYAGKKNVPTYAEYLQGEYNEDKGNTNATNSVLRGLKQAGATMKTDKQRKKK